MHLLEVEKQPGLDNNDLKVIFYVIPRIIFYVLLIQIALQKNWEEIWSRAEYIFGTIHSFINDFIGSFFSHKEIIDLYWEVYETQIIERIKNTEQKETVDRRC